MSEDLLTGLGVAAWAPAAASFLFGVAIGWLIFGARSQHDATSRASPPVESGADGGALDALQSQLKTARDLMTESDREFEDVADQLNTLDAALKRAHARLKSIFRTVRREKDR